MIGKLIRLLGLIIVAIGVILCNHAYRELNLARRAGLFLKTIGFLDGSMLKICGKDDPNISKLTSDLEEKKISDLKYYFYNIANPKEYLNGDDAIAVEKGPYMLKKYDVKYGVGFKTSSLTDAGEPSVNGAVEYDVANAYVVLDKNTDVTTTMSRDADLKLSWADSKRKTLASYDKSFPTHLSMSDKMTNLAPAYLSALGEINDEFSLVLTMSCTPDQVANIHDANNKGQCSSSQLNNMTESKCACCMLQDEYDARSKPSDFDSCNDYLDDEGGAMSLLSLLAYFDGGVVIKEKGDDKYDGSGKFNKTAYDQDKIYTPLIQSHTVNDLLFGYPSAYIGKVLPNVYFAQGEKIMKDAGVKNPTTKQTATEMLTGEMDDKLPFKFTDMAAYTKDVGAVCYDKCTSVKDGDDLEDSPLGHVCTGNAPARHSTKVTDEIMLGEVDCKPYSATYYTKKLCKDIDFALDQNSNAKGYQKCECANGKNDYKDKGCCLASGMYDNNDLTAEGCLYPVAGEAGSNYVGKDSEASGDGKPTVDVGKAVESWSTREDSAKNTQFMCPAKGVMIPEHSSFARYEGIDGNSIHDAYVHTGNARIRQDDASHSAATVHSAKINGGSTEYFKGTGMSAYFSHVSISDGHLSRLKNPIYIKDSLLPIMFEEDWGIQAIVCDEDGLCHRLARLLASADAFLGTPATQLEGFGMPFDGLQSVGHTKGPGDSGRPMYIHQPLYLNGDKDLYDQQNNSYVEGLNGNGVKIYRPKDFDSDPGTFKVGETNEKFELVDGTLVMSKADDLQSYIDVEPATGLGIRSKMRFGVSYSLWECDPSTNENCKLSRNSDGSGSCYDKVGDEIFKNLNDTVKKKLESANTKNFTYPCSAANIMSPKAVGGKIIPMYWYEDARNEVEEADIKVFSDMAKEYYVMFDDFMWVFTLGFFLFTALGMGLLLRCFWFAAPREFLKQGALGGAKSDHAGTAGTQSSTTAD